MLPAARLSDEMQQGKRKEKKKPKDEVVVTKFPDSPPNTVDDLRMLVQGTKVVT